MAEGLTTGFNSAIRWYQFSENEKDKRFKRTLLENREKRAAESHAQATKINDLNIANAEGKIFEGGMIEADRLWEAGKKEEALALTTDLLNKYKSYFPDYNAALSNPNIDPERPIAGFREMETPGEEPKYIMQVRMKDGSIKPFSLKADSTSDIPTIPGQVGGEAALARLRRMGASRFGKFNPDQQAVDALSVIDETEELDPIQQTNIERQREAGALPAPQEQPQTPQGLDSRPDVKPQQPPVALEEEEEEEEVGEVEVKQPPPGMTGRRLRDWQARQKRLAQETAEDAKQQDEKEAALEQITQKLESSNLTKREEIALKARKKGLEKELGKLDPGSLPPSAAEETEDPESVDLLGEEFDLTDKDAADVQRAAATQKPTPKDIKDPKKVDAIGETGVRQLGRPNTQEQQVADMFDEAHRIATGGDQRKRPTRKALYGAAVLKRLGYISGDEMLSIAKGGTDEVLRQKLLLGISNTVANARIRHQIERESGEFGLRMRKELAAIRASDISYQRDAQGLVIDARKEGRDAAQFRVEQFDRFAETLETMLPADAYDKDGKVRPDIKAKYVRWLARAEQTYNIDPQDMPAFIAKIEKWGTMARAFEKSQNSGIASWFRADTFVENLDAFASADLAFGLNDPDTLGEIALADQTIRSYANGDPNAAIVMREMAFKLKAMGGVEDLAQVSETVGGKPFIVALFDKYKAYEQDQLEANRKPMDALSWTHKRIQKLYAARQQGQ